MAAVILSIFLMFLMFARVGLPFRKLWRMQARGCIFALRGLAEDRQDAPTPSDMETVKAKVREIREIDELPQKFRRHGLPVYQGSSN